MARNLACGLNPGNGAARGLHGRGGARYGSGRVPTVYIETYGCQMNVADTELVLGHLAAHGYRRTVGPDGADVILLNTCAIREHAEERVIGRLGELASGASPARCCSSRYGPSRPPECARSSSSARRSTPTTTARGTSPSSCAAAPACRALSASASPRPIPRT